MRIRLLEGSGTGPTELAARDVALLDAGVGNYNLVRLSSVIPASATIQRPATVPSLGPTGGILHVVEAARTVRPGHEGAVALGWGRRADGQGLFYEASSEHPVDVTDGGATVATQDPPGKTPALAARIKEGLEHGFAARDWGEPETTVLTATVRATGSPASVVLLAAYGEAHSLDDGSDRG